MTLQFDMVCVYRRASLMLAVIALQFIVPKVDRICNGGERTEN
jgi:hypothetical protein